MKRYPAGLGRQVSRETVRAKPPALAGDLADAVEEMVNETPAGFRLAKIDIYQEHRSKGSRYFVRAEYHREAFHDE